MSDRFFASAAIWMPLVYSAWLLFRVRVEKEGFRLW